MVVDTPNGPVRGGARGGVLRFGGVPYARADTVRLTRAGVVDASRSTRRDPAPRRRRSVGGLDLVPGMVPDRQAEDVPHRRGRRASPSPGCCVPGAGLGPRRELPDRRRRRSPPTTVRALAGEGLVVVGVNYRLGALGWLAAEGVPTEPRAPRPARRGRVGTRGSTGAFGGDPDRIVLMGESAGAGAIAHLLAAGDAPVAGAILQSGAPAATLDVAAVEWVGERLLDAAGVAGVAALASTSRSPRCSTRRSRRCRRR